MTVMMMMMMTMTRVPMPLMSPLNPYQAWAQEWTH
jgi:hypothetical protein